MCWPCAGHVLTMRWPCADHVPTMCRPWVPGPLCADNGIDERSDLDMFADTELVRFPVYRMYHTPTGVAAVLMCY